ncbi:MAG: hypothetical protein ACRENE_01020 [Polyangiaceae bacterium]
MPQTVWMASGNSTMVPVTASAKGWGARWTGASQKAAGRGPGPGTYERRTNVAVVTDGQAPKGSHVVVRAAASRVPDVTRVSYRSIEGPRPSLLADFAAPGRRGTWGSPS